MNDQALSPPTKSARHQRIIDLVTHHEIRSQGELAERLGALDVHVTQATLSRDLVELNAVKVRSRSGPLVYAVPAEGGDRSPVAPRETVASAQRLGRPLVILMPQRYRAWRSRSAKRRRKALDRAVHSTAIRAA